ncbi:hypothetical protein FC84_GL000408 [Lapidilactobacillus dextrinicus DSM 20335]|uniref:Isoleucyl-tRNA synthetase n=1 Tax=Lapidilactobacillus dextrinicus DSM 20335 TaxID=1423738 RepID=A0A0R2BH93_9LACO|nr:hypothetical protein [Lapidilactobacillus dextrinicus]KRM78673.1 hypothetical protein FC84_GL000408 [Lapidilactobacillus dextrinicus DSM 20335]
MNASELFDKVKGLVSGGNLDDAKSFIEDHKDELGDYLEQAKGLLDGGDLLDKAKDLFK